MALKQGLFIPKHPEKYQGNVRNITYRSSWELRVFKWCDQNPSILYWSSEEIIIPYICGTDNTPHRYFPDLKLVIKDSTGSISTYLVEIKPYKETQPPNKRSKNLLNETLTFVKNQSKWKAARSYCSSRNWKFMILTEYELGLKKQSK